jgi:hypothetical protein
MEPTGNDPMESEQNEFLRPRLEQAQETLRESLAEACGEEIYSADTGQLIRIEEMLAIADEAAKEAISIRRRLRGDEERERPAPSDDLPRSATVIESDDGVPVEAHRLFEDASGTRWDAFAIHPSASAGRVRLPEPYRTGWLAFDSMDEKRRLSPIPDGWLSMPEEALRSLCERAEIVPRRSSLDERRTTGA